MDFQEEFFDAIKSGHRAEIIDLIERYPELLDARADDKVPPVLLAMYYNEAELAQMLIAAGATLDVFTAAAVNHRQTLQDMVAAQPNLVNAYAADGFQPLGLASFFGALDSVQFLIRMGADPNSASKNQMRVAPLHSAVANQHLDIARLLLESGADVNARQADDFTPLHGAAQNGQIEMVLLLCEYGADKTAVNAGGITPLEMAQRLDHKEIAEFLQS